MFNLLFVFFYCLLFILLWWLYFGYLMFIFLRASLNEQDASQQIYPSEDVLPVTLIIPCKDEEKIIKEKIKNTLKIDYPQNKMTVIFVDGGSTDKTVPIIKKTTKECNNIKLHIANRPGKINQLNEVLPLLETDIVICTDADCILHPGAIKTITSLFQARNDLGVVGIKTTPYNALPDEAYFWDQQNRLRSAESRYYSPLYVVATCYAFRRKVIEQFPNDVIADDIYISFLAIKRGFKTWYTDQLMATELRCPSTYKLLLTHKYRKTNAYIRELFRFFFAFFNAPLRWQVIFYTRAFQVLTGPFILLMLISIFFYTLFTSITGLLPFLTFIVLSTTYLFIRPTAIKGILKKLRLFILLHLVLLYTLLSYPFYRQTSNYKKTS